ncbi:MAG: LPS export ABC transporter permease LptF [Nitrospinota bacterium]
MRLLSRYIFKELVSVFALALFIFTLVLLLNWVLRLTELVVNKGVPFSVVLKLVVYLAPSFLILIIPTALLVSAITVFSQLSTDGEIIAMKATGMSFLRMLGPVLVLSVVAYGATSYLIFVAFPAGSRAFQHVMFDLARTKAALEIKPRVFNDTFSGLVLYAQEVHATNNLVKGVFIADRRLPNEPQTIAAQEGRLRPDPARGRVVLQLRNGTIHKLLPGMERYQILHFRLHDLALNLSEIAGAAQVKKGVKQMWAGELKHLAENAPPGSRQGTIALVEYYKKYSLPVAALLLGFVGAPLGMVNRRSGRAGGFAMSAVVVLFYYLLYTTGEGLGDEGRIPALVAMWMPNVIIAVLALYLVTKTALERPFTYSQAVMQRLATVGRSARRLVMGRLETP